MSTKLNLLLFCFTILMLSQLAAAQLHQCKSNEEWVTCGTACPPKCSGQPGFCTYQCIIGCQCKRGFLLNDAGECVLPEQC